MLQEVRARAFSHWSHRASPSSAQMIEAGFFCCNVGDRVICLYCNLICQKWIPHTNNPCEVHEMLSPNCVYVKTILAKPKLPLGITENENILSMTTIHNQTSEVQNFDRYQFVRLVACHPPYAELPKRHESFATWPNGNLPSVDNLVKAGFFYTGTKTIVTCFYCDGSLQNWGPNDNPMIEHARWFPHCAYGKQLCGDELYRKIQEYKRAQEGMFLFDTHY